MAAEAKAQTELKDFKSLFSLDGKVVLVTGGSRGLGLHAASGYVLPHNSRVQILIHNLTAFYKPAAPKYTSPLVKLQLATKLAPLSMLCLKNGRAQKPFQYLPIVQR